MQKTGLKTFVYSFSVSLFAIFAANGIYLHTRPSVRQDIKIPSKNVMLFLKDDAFNPSLKPAPVKKIALSVLPELKQEPEALPVQAGGAVYEPPIDEIILADNFIPLENGGVFEETAETDEELRPIEFIPSQPAAVTMAANRPPAKDNGTKISVPRLTPEIAASEPPAIKIAAASAKPEKADTPPALKAKTEADKSVLTAEAKLPLPLFPLEKSRDAKLDNRKIKIGEPDKLNQVALADKSIPISSMENRQAKETPPPPEWKQMSDKKNDSPWVVAKGAGVSRNELLSQEEYYKKENEQIKAALNLPSAKNTEGSVQVASDTVKNLLIPIPEDILNDENLVPQLSYSSNEKEKAKDKEFDEKMAAENEAARDNAGSPKPQPAVITEKPAAQKNILASLNTIFSSKTKVKEAKKTPEKKSGLLTELQRKLSPAKKVTIMPTEMRLSFQPNRAEISGQTLRWIQAFAARAAEDNFMSIEIRIDGTSGMELQQKRLNLLHNILTNKGVEYSKINTVFTSREPNSFIIRTVTRNYDRRGLNRNNNTQTAGRYLQW